MSATADGPAPRAKIGRQSIHDRAGTVVGYELLFGPGASVEGGDPAGLDRSTSELMVTAFGDFGLQRLGFRRNLYVNMTRAFLTGERAMPFGPHNVVLEVLEHLEVDAELLEGVRQLKYRGYRVAIDGYVSGPEHPALLAIVDVVKLDVPEIGADLVELVAYVREAAPSARLMADRVADRACLDACVAAGFDLFQGNHYQRPAQRQSAGVGPSQVISLQLLAALADPDSSTNELERIVSADPGLSLRVLGTVNSAAGAGQQIKSLRQALVLLGRRSLSAWVMLAALGGHPESQREDMIDVLTRARGCELLCHHVPGVAPATAYAAGLLSGVVDVMGADPHQIARTAHLDAAMTAALVHREGPIGELLTAMVEFDRTGLTRSAIPASDLSRAHLHALGTAIETIDSILGQPA